MGLKPIIKLICPEYPCDFKFKYHARDPRMHPDMWVMTAESRAHLETGHVKILNAVINTVQLGMNDGKDYTQAS